MVTEHEIVGVAYANVLFNCCPRHFNTSLLYVLRTSFEASLRSVSHVQSWQFFKGKIKMIKKTKHTPSFGAFSEAPPSIPPSTEMNTHCQA